jgi:hypothetical protein
MSHNESSSNESNFVGQNHHHNGISVKDNQTTLLSAIQNKIKGACTTSKLTFLKSSTALLNEEDDENYEEEEFVSKLNDY